MVRRTTSESEPLLVPHRLPGPAVEATLLVRENRFLARCRLPSGEEVAAHVPDRGRLLEILKPGARHPGVDGARVFGVATGRAVVAATKDYRDSSDVMGDFFDERCVVGWVSGTSPKALPPEPGDGVTESLAAVHRGEGFVPPFVSAAPGVEGHCRSEP